MAIEKDTLAHLLFKQAMGKSSTRDIREFFEEPFNGRSFVLTDQIWTQSGLIPSTAPTLAADGISGIIQYKEDLVLTVVPGTTNSFYHSDLKDCIPFNFDVAGSYNYFVKDNLGTHIPFGLGDWIVDTTLGVLTFYGDVPSNMPPSISFYKYIGTKGDLASGATGDTILTIVDKNLSPIATSGDEADTNINISITPPERSVVEIKVNGLSYLVGDGVKTEQCYFADPSDLTVAKTYTGATRIVSGDRLVWNGLISEFDLEIDDTISIYYAE